MAAAQEKSCGCVECDKAAWQQCAVCEVYVCDFCLEVYGRKKVEYMLQTYRVLQGVCKDHVNVFEELETQTSTECDTRYPTSANQAWDSMSPLAQQFFQRTLSRKIREWKVKQAKHP